MASEAIRKCSCEGRKRSQHQQSHSANSLLLHTHRAEQTPRRTGANGSGQSVAIRDSRVSAAECQRQNGLCTPHYGRIKRMHSGALLHTLVSDISQLIRQRNASPRRRRRGHIEMHVMAGQSSALAWHSPKVDCKKRESKVLVVVVMMAMVSKASATVVVGEIPNRMRRSTQETAHSTITSVELASCTAA